MARNRHHRREKRRARQEHRREAMAERTATAPARDRGHSVVYRVRGGGPEIRFDFFPTAAPAPDLYTDFPAVLRRMDRLHRALWQATENEAPS